MDDRFSILGHSYRMRDPNVFGADVRIQQTRKAYFNRSEGIGEGETRFSVRVRYDDWITEQVTDTSLDDVITVCAMMEPIGDAPYLTPEYLLAAPSIQLRVEIAPVISFFLVARDGAAEEWKKSNSPSTTTTEASIPPIAETSTPESTSPLPTKTD